MGETAVALDTVIVQHFLETGLGIGFGSWLLDEIESFFIRIHGIISGRYKDRYFII
jgi:hypothetical protein